MRFSAIKKILTSTLVLLFLFSAGLSAQTYSFKNFGEAATNIPNGFVYTINQSDDGFLWVGTGNGIARFDGFNFFRVQYPDSVENRNTTASLRDKNGRIWFGFNDGSVFYTTGNTLQAVELDNSKSISDIIEGPDGFIYVIPQGKAVFSINPEKPGEVNQYLFSSDPVMFSASFTKTGNLLIGTQENILICTLEKNAGLVIGTIGGFEYASITSIHSTGDNSDFIIGTNGSGLYHLKISDNNHEIKRFSNHNELESLDVQEIIEDSDKSVWIATFGSGALKLILSEDFESIESVQHFETETGLTSNDVKTVFQDKEGNYWMGFYYEGISILESYAFGYYQPGSKSTDNNIIYVADFDKRYILGTPSGFHLFDAVNGKSVSFTDLTRYVGQSGITAYFLDNEKNLWIGTEGNGLFVRYNSGLTTRFFRSGDSGVDFIKDIIVSNNKIWLATNNGVLILDKRSANEIKRFDINNGLSHNSINKLMEGGHNGTIYIGTESVRLYSIDDQFNITDGKAVMQGSSRNKILSFAEDKNGAIWAGTLGNGIFKCLNDSASALTMADGLMSNYCYSILSDSENDIWIGHEKGFSRFNQETGLMKVFGTGFARGGVCNPNAMFESEDKKIFIGTTEGLIIYDKLKDKRKSIPPFTNINSVSINDVIYPYKPAFSLPYNKRNIIRIYYSGINFSSPDKVYYSTFLENFDDEWSKMSTSREVSYNLNDGKYKFNVVSMGEGGLSQESPVSLEIFIKSPIWRTWWFILGIIALLAGTVFIIIRERDKAQKKIQEYLEKELALRTSVVMKQKGEIEIQNIAITDSINYAKRIQSSILPDISKLKESFRDAFILFHPRDIVSGDFYWFDKLDDDKFILVCADSTGHGVPGAFMSMIGSTLLQDIVTRKRISRPSEILKLLDKQIFSTLNQNVELGVSNDGMDMVICEFNIKTRHIRFASAMRPVIIVLDGESYYIKGNRSSVGGESVIEKYYDDQEYYLSEGDTVYLFSDGLPDQFGGAEGKKLKIARLKKMIEQVAKLPMEEQKEIMSKFFFDWKGSLDQVDDILIMGVKV